jgi:hypothetical protein
MADLDRLVTSDDAPDLHEKIAEPLRACGFIVSAATDARELLVHAKLSHCAARQSAP